MNRHIVYPLSVPQDVDILYPQQHALFALGYLMQMVLGTSSLVQGFAVLSASYLTVTIGPGSMTFLTTAEATAFGSLPANTANSIVKMGINTGSTTVSFTAPTTAGYSTAYIIQAAFSEQDDTPIVLPYVNAANPALPFAGPSNTGTPMNTRRTETVTISAKAGTPAPTGSQVAPTPDAGAVALYSIVIANGQTIITTGEVSQIANAPYVPFTLPQLRPGTSQMALILITGTWQVPDYVTSVKLRMWGGGGGGGPGGGTGYVGGGGAGGGYMEAWVQVTPGAVIAVTIGAGGASGAAGGTTSFGVLASVTGGGGGGAGSSSSVGIGSSSPGGFVFTSSIEGGAYGQIGQSGGNGIQAGTILISGNGGGCGLAPTGGASGSGTTSSNIAGNSTGLLGGGGSGGIGTGAGGAGNHGQVIVEW